MKILTKYKEKSKEYDLIGEISLSVNVIFFKIYSTITFFPHLLFILPPPLKLFPLLTNCKCTHFYLPLGDNTLVF